MTMKFLLCLCISLYIFPIQGKISYKGHSVVRIQPKTDEQVEKLKDLFTEEKGYDVWRYSTKPGLPFDVRLNPAQYETVKEELFKLNLKSEVMIKDVQETADEQQTTESLSAESFNYSVYHNLEQIDKWIDTIGEDYSEMAHVIEVTSSYEGRPIRGLKINTGQNTRSTKTSKFAIWLQGGIHAREWISPATVMYVTSKLLADYEKGDMDRIEWYIIPVFNVDGYAFTWTEDRMWRKTRSSWKGIGSCVGVDPNRNWDFKWGGLAEEQNPQASSSNPCDDTYRGPKAFSENSVKGVADYLTNLNTNTPVKGFLDIHSYSQLWMTPWGYADDIPVHYVLQDNSSAAATAAIYRTSGFEYKHGRIASTIYPANGNSVDWAYGKLGVIFSAAVELRDTGKYGFLLPADQIVSCGDEFYAGLVEYAKFVLENSE